MPIGKDLIGYWRMNGDGDEIVDSSGNGNNGVLINGTRGEGIPTAGEPSTGKAISLTGVDDSHGSIPVSESLNSYTDQFTVSAWVFPTVPPDDFNPVVSRQTLDVAHPDQFFLGFGPQDGIQYKWHLSTDTGMLGDIYAGTAEFDRWIHLAGTYDGEIMRLYVDGVEIGNQAISGNIPLDDNPVTFGAEENGDIPLDVLGELEGLIDEVRMYNRALDAGEIQEIYSLASEALVPTGVEPNNTIVSDLDGAQEVAPGDPDAKGKSVLTLNDLGDSLEYSLTVSGLDFGANGLIEGGAQTEDTSDDVTRIHIHNAPRGVNGDIVFSVFDVVIPELGNALNIPGNQDEDLTATLNQDGSVTLKGIWEETDLANTALSEFVDDIRNAAVGEDLNLYWNVHTNEYPEGAIRGQLMAGEPDLTTTYVEI